MVHEHMHALIQRAADGTKLVPLHKRDDYSDNVHNFIHKIQHNTNAENIRLNVPAGFAQKAAGDLSASDSNNGVAVEVLYVTASASFSGSTLGFVTDVATSTPAANIQPSNAAVNAASVATSAASVASPATSATPAKQAPTVGTPIAQNRTTAQSTPTADAANANATAVSQQSTGMTDGAKAGLAIGLIFGIALIAGLFFFCWKRSKKDSSRDELNEKSGFTEKRSSFFGAGANGGSKRASADSDKSFGTIHTPATAPRLSLRPVTQFLPAFGEKRKSSITPQPQMSQKPSAWERGPQNPFRDPAAQAQNPFDEGDGSSQHSKASSEGTEPPSTPNSAQFGTAAAVPVTAQGPPRTPNNVHRVQLDFKPSMDDELELKSGQLVRCLHEYDDGWALCIRMDRSQQGVVPRTCLSAKPVKPRGPPSAGRVSPPGMRGPAPPQSPVARKPVPGQAI